MNKIVLDKEKNINLNVSEDTTCIIPKGNNINDLNINISDGVKLIINQYSEVIENNLFIRINQSNNSDFIYNHSFVSKKEYNLNINVNMIGNNSKNIINVHGISDEGKSKVVVDGNVIKDTHDNELYENIKLLNINNGTSNIYPNMYIDTKNVIANHSASISTVNEDYIFYLMSKGIDRKNAIKLILDGFLENDAR